jgi:replicative DNA helicase
MMLNSDFYKLKLESNEKEVIHCSNYSELDSLVNGFAEGELVVITGLFGNGKSLFSKSLIRSFSLQSIPSAVFSFEESTMRFLEPFIADGINNFPFFVPGEMVSGNPKWLEERIIESKVKNNCKIVLVDHLHYVVEMGSENLAISIGSVMRRLALLANLERIVIFLVCHQKAIDSKVSSEPALHHCRDSSAIPQECSTGLVINRIKDRDETGKEFDSYEQGYCWVKIDKARRAGTYRKKITFQKVGNWLEPI